MEFDDKPWDYAAGIAILLEAGGRVSDVDGTAFTFRDARYVATNGAVHDEVLSRIARAGAVA